MKTNLEQLQALRKDVGEIYCKHFDLLIGKGTEVPLLQKLYVRFLCEIDKAIVAELKKLGGLNE